MVPNFQAVDEPKMSELKIDAEIRTRLREALLEDIGEGDLTTQATVAAGVRARGRVRAKAEGVFCGFPVFQEIYRLLDEELGTRSFVKEGEIVAEGTLVAEVTGEARQILHGERLALNLLGRMSGVATLTRQMIDRMNRPGTALLDTRKTLPLWRSLDKYAVRAGGGQNHRCGLYDMILIKENHIALAGGIRPAIEAAKAQRPEGVLIEVEAQTLAQVQAALEAGPDLLLLDNFTVGQLREAVQCAGGRVELEASGGISLNTIEEIAATGVDRISVGALTHSARALDLSMKVKPLSE